MDRTSVKYYVTQTGDFFLEPFSVRASSDKLGNENISCK